MLLVKTKIKSSEVAGIGLFADEFIPKGTRTWKFQEGFDIRVPKDYPDILPEPAKTFFLTHAYQNPKTLNWVLCADNARFCNHSDNPNITHTDDPEDEEPKSIANRDIQKGEELFVNYGNFDANPLFGFDKK